MIWLILASTVISGVNAVVRKAFNFSSNAYLEVQWYLFAAAFLLAAGYTLLHGEHVKIDVISGQLSKRKQIWIDVIGFAFFLLPVCLVDPLLRHAVLPARLPLRRDVVQRRRPDPLAGVPHDPARLHAAAAAGLVRTDQAHRLPARA